MAVIYGNRRVEKKLSPTFNTGSHHGQNQRRKNACQGMSSVLSNESKKLAGHSSDEDRFGRYPYIQEPDGVKRLEREKIDKRGGIHT